MFLRFGADAFSWLFFALVSFMWIVVGIFAIKYSDHLDHKKRFFTFYILTYVMLGLLCFSQSYLSMYLSFEMMTLCSMPLVLHDGRKESIDAAKKYLFYSIFGATLGLLGMFFAANYASVYFVQGGALSSSAKGHESAILIAIFLTIVGFGAKAGLFPLHSWLPAAHPQAPGPASAVLSGVITKAGVLCIIRVIFYIYGPEIIRGTWVQYTLLGLAMLTIFMGSLMAYNQKHLKRRLAYSTVSQVSYILFGIFTLNSVAMTGSLLHIIYHSVIKNLLFLVAAELMFKYDIHNVDEIEGMGRKMPITFGCFTVASLGLVGVPPFAGFLSKWYIATGSLLENIPVIKWLGPAVLLASALMTAAYLLSICIKAFFPRKEILLELNEKIPGKGEAPVAMLFPVILLGCLVVILGIFAKPWADLFFDIAGGLF